MGWTTDKREHARRLAICAECPHAVLTVAGACDTCRRPAIVKSARTDDDLACKRKDCAGAVTGKEIARCGACGCPLASRVYATCPKGKW
ncbi:MAG: hypothetical protein R3215_02175 [Halomonas sp.]|nr:hypothetical protein [Halomonas sp.]